MDNSINELLVSLKKGDDGAFASIEKQYTPLIDNLTQNLMSLPDMDGDDFRQEAIIALYMAACSYDPSKTSVTFGLYAKICIRNRLISILRRRRCMTDELCEDLIANEDDNPEYAAINAAGFESLMEKIEQSLTELEKSVFKLYISGTANEDIGSSLGLARKSIDNAIYRIRAKIRKLI
ncbi:MAG: sigma-70 family RNA polymerase sigma factor [Clostridia bacterium]|nr:sigma-70 family RNA polymerase sigma factor [Clostridia bacterium]